MPETPSILVVEDDEETQRLLSVQLQASGFTVQAAGSGPAALAKFAARPPSLVLVDITLPGIDGLEVCRKLRSASAVPIILVTAAGLPEMKVRALELGADDYITKPFHAGELVARIRAVLRRATRPLGDEGPVETGDLTIDRAHREVRRNGEAVRLTRIEFDLLWALVSRGGRVAAYPELLQEVWGPGYDDVRAVHVHVCNLRRKLEPGPTSARHILAVPGVGYRYRESG